MARENGFYWVERFHDGWEVALWKGGRWWISGGFEYGGDKRLKRIIETKLVHPEGITELQVSGSQSD